MAYGSGELTEEIDITPTPPLEKAVVDEFETRRVDGKRLELADPGDPVTERETRGGELNIGHLYQVLDRLERDRLVTKRVVPQEDRPDRVVYRLTKGGREEPNRWLETPFVRPAYRDDLFLKLLASSRLGRPRIEALVRLQREAYLGELKALAELRRRHRDEPLVALLIEAAVLHTKADLRLRRARGSCGRDARAGRRSSTSKASRRTPPQPAPAHSRSAVGSTRGLRVSC
ncbi:MAG: helix-turn-helix transcriptional regulator [Solirubrobacterales bacterium]